MKFYYLGIEYPQVIYRFYNSYLPFKLAFSIEQLLLKLKGYKHFSLMFLEGIISGIPICCVSYYSWWNRNGNFYMWDDDDIPYFVNYLPCPKCLKKGRFAHGKKLLFIDISKRKDISKKVTS